MESLPLSSPEVGFESPGLTDERVKELQQQFLERRQIVVREQQERKWPVYDVHYADVPEQVIPLIDTRDVHMMDDIHHIANGQQLKQVQTEFDEYFLQLDQRKRAVAIILLRELRAQGTKLKNQRRKIK